MSRHLVACVPEERCNEGGDAVLRSWHRLEVVAVHEINATSSTGGCPANKKGLSWEESERSAGCSDNASRIRESSQVDGGTVGWCTNTSCIHIRRSTAVVCCDGNHDRDDDESAQTTWERSFCPNDHEATNVDGRNSCHVQLPRQQVRCNKGEVATVGRTQLRGDMSYNYRGALASDQRGRNGRSRQEGKGCSLRRCCQWRGDVAVTERQLLSHAHAHSHSRRTSENYSEVAEREGKREGRRPHEGEMPNASSRTSDANAGIPLGALVVRTGQGRGGSAGTQVEQQERCQDERPSHAESQRDDMSGSRSGNDYSGNDRSGNDYSGNDRSGSDCRGCQHCSWQCRASLQEEGSQEQQVCCTSSALSRRQEGSRDGSRTGAERGLLCEDECTTPSDRGVVARQEGVPSWRNLRGVPSSASASCEPTGAAAPCEREAESRGSAWAACQEGDWQCRQARKSIQGSKECSSSSSNSIGEAARVRVKNDGCSSASTNERRPTSSKHVYTHTHTHKRWSGSSPLFHRQMHSLLALLLSLLLPLSLLPLTSSAPSSPPPTLLSFVELMCNSSLIPQDSLAHLPSSPPPGSPHKGVSCTTRIPTSLLSLPSLPHPPPLSSLSFFLSVAVHPTDFLAPDKFVASIQSNGKEVLTSGPCQPSGKCGATRPFVCFLGDVTSSVVSPQTGNAAGSEPAALTAKDLKVTVTASPAVTSPCRPCGRTARQLPCIVLLAAVRLIAVLPPSPKELATSLYDPIAPFLPLNQQPMMRSAASPPPLLSPALAASPSPALPSSSFATKPLKISSSSIAAFAWTARMPAGTACTAETCSFTCQVGG